MSVLRNNILRTDIGALRNTKIRLLITHTTYSMTSPPKWLLIFFSFFPVIGQILFLYVLFFTYNTLLFIRPETTRSMIRDFIIGILTCGLFYFFVPTLVIQETKIGADRMNVKVPNFVPLSIVLACVNFFSYALFYGSFLLLFFLYFINQAILIYVFLTPFEILHKEFKDYLD